MIASLGSEKVIIFGMNRRQNKHYYINKFYNVNT